MSYTSKTEHYELPQWIGSDRATWIPDLNGAFSAIDGAIWEASSNSTASQNVAAAAKATADQASESAQTALSTAQSATTAADAATTTANGAVTTANQAVTAAGEAKTTANSAENFPVLPNQYARVPLANVDQSGDNLILTYSGVIRDDPTTTGLQLYFCVPKTYDLQTLTAVPTLALYQLSDSAAVGDITTSTPSRVPGTNYYQISVTGTSLTGGGLYYCNMYTLMPNPQN